VIALRALHNLQSENYFSDITYTQMYLYLYLCTCIHPPRPTNIYHERLISSASNNSVTAESRVAQSSSKYYMLYPPSSSTLTETITMDKTRRTVAWILSERTPPQPKEPMAEISHANISKLAITPTRSGYETTGFGGDSLSTRFEISEQTQRRCKTAMRGGGSVYADRISVDEQWQKVLKEVFQKLQKQAKRRLKIWCAVYGLTTSMFETVICGGPTRLVPSRPNPTPIRRGTYSASHVMSLRRLPNAGSRWIQIQGMPIPSSWSADVNSWPKLYKSASAF
jgi:hypothetical protein